MQKIQIHIKLKKMIQNIMIFGKIWTQIIQLQVHIQHINIVKFFGICLRPPSLYLVFELATHGTLRNLLDSSARKRKRGLLEFKYISNTKKGVFLVEYNHILYVLYTSNNT